MSRNSCESAPAWGSIAEWYFSAPALEARHWKNDTASDPYATWVRLSRRRAPGTLATLTGCQLTALVECSIRNHGWLSAMPRVCDAEKQSSSYEWGSAPTR